MVQRDGSNEVIASWAAAAFCVLVLFSLVSRYLLMFGLGVAVGLLVAYEFAQRWIGCLL